ncbi:MAG: zinc carboxypeptidase, partial [Flavobacteriaceae bacterium]|nr:zinc carboxypeptidase [Flavobacteriaceae bacterium]
HHHTTGLSTVEVAGKNHTQLNTEFRNFYSNKNHKYKNYVVYGNPKKINALQQLLAAHEINYKSTQNSKIKGYVFGKGTIGTAQLSGSNLVVSTDQPKGTLVDVLFEPQTKVSDSLTYDITAWTLPYAYGLKAVATNTPIITKAFQKQNIKNKSVTAMGYIAKWESMNDARFLAAIMQAGIKVRHNHKPFTTRGSTFNRGSLLILKHDNKKGFEKTLRNLANKHHIKL